MSDKPYTEIGEITFDDEHRGLIKRIQELEKRVHECEMRLAKVMYDVQEMRR